MSEKISIETSLNVIVDYQLADVWQRLWGFIIDGIIKWGYIIAIILILSSASEPNYILISILVLPYIFYTLVFELINNGVTPGKKAMNIQVISIDGRNLTTGQIFTRWLLRFLDFWIMTSNVAFLSIVSTPKSQRIGDLVAGTAVISHTSKTSVEKSSRVKLPENFKGTNRQVMTLKDHEIELLKGVIRDKSPAGDKLRMAATEKLVDFLSIPKDIPSKDYLKKIVYDYNYYQRVDEGEIIEVVVPEITSKIESQEEE